MATKKGKYVDLTSKDKIRLRFRCYRDKIQEQSLELGKNNCRIKELKGVLSLLLSRCSGCNKHLELMDWNKESLLLVCDNAFCRFYRQPIENVRSNILQEEVKDDHRRSH